MQDLLTRLLLAGGGGFSPSALFGGGAVQGAWYDPSDFGTTGTGGVGTLYQDSAGTTPVTAVEQPVGLMLDKSKGLVLGPELVTNGDFSQGTTGWSTSTGFASTATVVSGEFQVTASVASGRQISAITCVIGRTYVVTGICRLISGTGSAFIGISDSTTGGSIYTATTNSTSTFVATRGQFVATATTMYVVTGSAGGQGVTAFDNISVRELAGNHAFQSTSASRPTLRARYNLLTQSEEFDNAVWNGGGLRTLQITANATTAPNGTLTADKAVEAAPAAGSVTQRIIFNDNTIIAQKTLSIYAKKAERKRIYLFVNGPDDGGWFDLDLGTCGPGTDYPGGAVSIASVGDGWFRCSLVPGGNSGSAYVQIAIIGDAQTTYASRVGDGVSGVFIWGAQLTATAVFPSNTYQRIAAATDYATGTAFPPYLFFDGTDDSMLTNSVDFTATDKMAVFAGVTKLDNAIQQEIVELSANAFSVNGAFYLFANTNGIGAQTAASYGINTRGTSNAGAGATGTTAPISNVVTGLFDIAASSGAAILRVNGAQVATSGATSAGTGNFSNNPLYIGRRNNATIPFNGQIYSLIIQGATPTSSQLVSTEQWVAAKTPLGSV